MSQTLLLFDISEISKRLIDDLRSLQSDYTYVEYGTRLEDIYDWIIIEALSRVMSRTANGASVRHHHADDLCKCLYGHVEHYVEPALYRTVRDYSVLFLPHESVKVLVTYRLLYVIRADLP